MAARGDPTGNLPNLRVPSAYRLVDRGKEMEDVE
jgi:hypothetical protein